MPSPNFAGSITGIFAVKIDNAAAAGENVVIAAVPNKIVRVFGMRLNVSGATIILIRNGSGGAILERFNFAGNGGGMTLDLRELSYYTTAAGNALVISSSAAVQVDGMLEYTQG